MFGPRYLSTEFLRRYMLNKTDILERNYSLFSHESGPLVVLPKTLRLKILSISTKLVEYSVPLDYHTQGLFGIHLCCQFTYSNIIPQPNHRLPSGSYVKYPLCRKIRLDLDRSVPCS